MFPCSRISFPFDHLQKKYLSSSFRATLPSLWGAHELSLTSRHCKAAAHQHLALAKSFPCYLKLSHASRPRKKRNQLSQFENIEPQKYAADRSTIHMGLQQTFFAHPPSASAAQLDLRPRPGDEKPIGILFPPFPRGYRSKAVVPAVSSHTLEQSSYHEINQSHAQVQRLHTFFHHGPTASSQSPNAETFRVA